MTAFIRVRYSSIPVVVAPHNMALGGGCELCLHADKVQTSAETYMGLVEFGVGLIPAGGGTKEFAVRFSDELKEGDVEINALRNRFLTIGQAKVSTSGEEAFELGYLRRGHDQVTINKNPVQCAVDYPGEVWGVIHYCLLDLLFNSSRSSHRRLLRTRLFFSNFRLELGA